ncbi:hypothetical protein [Halalkalibacterium ligniniphilum]|uniref:hypothetical protein n=1 Tax=Halalkalibacterium ligniniphilum TaxID=1134413 RepID=UPI000348E111|nr:hypothetical protein [Halalkalibacterium ligniniphilum]
MKVFKLYVNKAMHKMYSLNEQGFTECQKELDKLTEEGVEKRDVYVIIDQI